MRFGERYRERERDGESEKETRGKLAVSNSAQAQLRGGIDELCKLLNWKPKRKG